jgi:hypothetical protein
MLFKRRPRDGSEAAPDTTPPKSGKGELDLRDELGMHQLWYLDMRLKEELARASRSGAVFSLATWEPRMLPGDVMDPQVLTACAKLIVGKLRTYDLTAQIGDNRFAAVLLDADNHEASTVVFRIKADMQVQVPGGGKWKAGVATYGRDGADADSLIQVALRRMDEAAAA